MGEFSGDGYLPPSGDEEPLSGPESDEFGSSAEGLHEEHCKLSFAVMLDEGGFTNVALTCVPVPEQVLAWIRQDERQGNVSLTDKEIEEEVDEFRQGLKYYRVSSDQGTLGMFFTAYMPVLDLTDTGVEPEEYIPGHPDSLIPGTKFAPCGDVNDLHRLGTLLAAKKAARPQPTGPTAEAAVSDTSSHPKASDAAPSVPAPEDDDEPTVKTV